MNAQEKIDQLMKAEMEHIRSVGGILNLPEADSVLNDLNREKLKALKELHGHLYLGRINIHDTAQRLRVVEGTEDVYEEMLDQPLYNFCCDFAVPVKDKILSDLIRAWNARFTIPGMKDAQKITERVEQLGGVNLIWT